MEAPDAHADELGMSREGFIALTPHIDDKYFEWCSTRWKEKLEEMAVAFDDLNKAIIESDYDNQDELKNKALICLVNTIFTCGIEVNMIQIYKGIFWYNPINKKLIVKKVACDKDGVAFEHVEYSSKSGNNFNHKAEWGKFPKSITRGQPYNYYPRGRVEIKNNKAKVYLNPILICHDQYAKKPRYPVSLIEKEFGLGLKTISADLIPDNSKHYGYLIEYPNVEEKED